MPLFKILSPHPFAIRRRAEIGCEIDEELRFHLEMRTQENINAGMTSDEAQQDAVKRFGDLERIKLSCQKIKRENGNGLKALKLLLWVVVGIGLSLRLVASVHEIRPIGNTLVMIAILSRLLIYARSMRPDKYTGC